MSANEAWSKFRAFDWNSNEKWQDIKKQIDNGTIEFPSGNYIEAIEKMKYKFYKSNVDPSFDPSVLPTTSNASSTSTSSTSSSNSNSSQPRQTFENPRNPPPQSSVPPEANSALTPLRLIWYFAHLFHVINAVFYFLPIIGSTYESYYRAIYGASLSYGLSLYRSVGAPQFNQEYAARLLMNDNTHYLLLCLALMLSVPLPNALMPLVLYSLLHIASFTVTNSVKLIPVPVQPFYRTRIEPLLHKVLGNKQQLLLAAASLEFFTMILSFVFVFFGGGPILPLAYYWFLQLRYLYSSNSRFALDAIGVKLDSVFLSPKSPGLVQKIYSAVRNYLRRSIQNRAQ